MFLQPRSSSTSAQFEVHCSQEMEFLGANCEREWTSLSGMHTSEEADFMAQLLGNSSFPNHHPSTLCHGHDESLSFNSLNHRLTDPPQSFHVNNSSMSLDFLVAEEQDNGNHKISFNNSRIRSRNSGDVLDSKRNVKAKKIQKAVPPSSDKEGNDRQSSSGCSEDESNGSQETTSLSSKRAPAHNSNWKSRASRGSATDPQSLYARKRRERINERLRILQKLVPNGTKVDISTMLEEAVQYVKFLQLQIKLLSSDDMWMYAPIAYNGMSIGLDFKVPASRES